MESIFLRGLRKAYKLIIGHKKRGYFANREISFSSQEASDLIYDQLISKNPCMISRLGNTEFSCVYQYKVKKSGVFCKYFKYINGDIDSTNYTPLQKHKITNNAGFFPATDEQLDRFSEMMLDDIEEIDVFGSIIALEYEFEKELANASPVGFEDLNAYNHKNPWTRALLEKNVLVIHPFSESIQSQYKKRKLIFEKEDYLPSFNLLTLKPVQSIAESEERFLYKDWFEALDTMKDEIEKLDFDIAIIGCGAYGLPLAAHIKRIGKKSIHLGGATQMHFGVVGRRWETEYDLKHLINKHWVRPNKNEIPENFQTVEDGCYW